MINTQDLYKGYLEKGGRLSYHAFRDIMHSYHKRRVQKCMDDGKAWHMRHNIGTIQVLLHPQKIKVSEQGTIRGSIDWKTSNDKKQAIIDRGGIPRKGDNGGEDWLCYHLSKFYVSWHYSSNIFLKNGLDYTFNISWSNSRALSKSVDEDVELKYTKKEGKKR